ncbi:MAG TPA: CoA transferase [Acidimicrobiales bacterium]|nr:CoA transferase [Acidimicrobiales bacterium]
MSGGPLSGLRGLQVLDLSGDVAGAYCAKLLADAGADVTKVEPPEGHRLRRWSVSGGVGLDGDSDSVLFRFLASSHQSRVVDPALMAAGNGLDGLATTSDVIIASTFGGRMTGEAPPVDVRALSERHPELVVVSLSAFGLSGPRGGEHSSDFLLQALAGSLFSHGEPDRLPLAVGGGLAEWTVGTFGALGALTALTARRQSGRGELVDVSALECLAVTFICYPSVVSKMPGGQRQRSTFVMVPGIEPCIDGYVGFATITTAQWHSFLDMIGRPDLADDVTLFNQLKRGRPDVLSAIEGWTRQHTVEDAVERGSMYRIPTVPIGNGETFPGLEHVVARHLYGRNPRGGFPHPRPPFRSSVTDPQPPQPAPTLAGRPGGSAPSPQGAPSASRAVRPFRAGRPPAEGTGSLPLTGVRVLDFTAFLAGPMCTQYLASVGADVVKIESVQRPDPMRYTVRVDAAVDQWYELGGIFQSANLNKRSVTLNLADPRGREAALRLVATADVVVENFTPRVMDQFGLDFDDLVAANPGIIMVRMPGFGLDGPWRDRPGFAATMEQVSGLAWITGYSDRLPTIPGICDPLAGMHAAFAVLSALEHREQTGEGQMIELAMIDLAAHLTVEQVLERSVYGHLMARQGNRLPGLAHQGVYACIEGDQWIALQVATDVQWGALRAVIGSPAWSLDPRLDTVGGRADRADLIDRELKAWFAQLGQKDALSALRSGGVEAEPVIHAYDVDLDEQMNARRFWEEVAHPLVGPMRFPGWPMRYASRTAPWHQRPAPLLGQHNDEVLSELGTTGEELATLRRDGIVGNRPAAL